MDWICRAGENITVKYSKLERPVSDSGVERYGTYKISILLTDGLAAIVGDRIFDGNRYDMFVFRPDEIHFGRFLRSGVHEYVDIYLSEEYFSLLPEGESLRFFFEDRSGERSNRISSDGDERASVAALVQRARRILQEGGAFIKTELSSIALQIVLICASLYPLQKRSGEGSVPPLVQRALTVLHENFSGRITVKELASFLGCSETYLSRTFKQYTGASVYGHLTDVRIQHAKEMLAEGQSVTDVCFACGFNDCSNFIRSFKESVGETPLQYKKRF